jgi:hypothetical protein
MKPISVIATLTTTKNFWVSPNPCITTAGNLYLHTKKVKFLCTLQGSHTFLDDAINSQSLRQYDKKEGVPAPLHRMPLERKVLRRTNPLLSLIRHGPHWKRRVQQFYCCVCIRYRGNVPTEPLPSNAKGIHIQTYTHTDWWDFFNYAVKTGSSAVIYVPSFIKIGSGIQKLIGGDTQTARRFISLLLVHKNKASRLKW